MVKYIGKYQYVLIIYIVISLLSHFYILTTPPCGTHVWRQSNTLSMARNFYEEGMNIFEPKIDRRNLTNGITGSHFPLYEWLLALLSKVFGYSETLARLYSLVIFSFGMLAMRNLIVFFTKNNFLALIAGLLLLFTPLFYYDSANAMPDVLALTLSMYGLYYYLKYFTKSGIQFLIYASLFSLLGGLIKFQFLIIPASAIVYFQFNKKQIIGLAIAVSFISALVFGWYKYAIDLMNKNDLKEFGLWIKPISLKEKMDTMVQNITIDLPEMIFGWALLLMSLLLVYKLRKEIRFNKPVYFILFWTLAFVAFYFLGIERFKNHAYYFFAFGPVPVFIFVFLAHKAKLSQQHLIIALSLTIVWAVARIYPAKWTPQKRGVPIEFMNKEQRTALENAIPKGEKCVIGSDISGCIYFYFTHTKGTSFEEADELYRPKNNMRYLDYLHKGGINYLILHESERRYSQLKSDFNLTKINKIGNFSVWLIN